MYPPKVPAVISKLERAIRQGDYGTHLPATSILQKEFALARQTVTEAVRQLRRLGLVCCSNRRGGMIIHRENLQSGTIAIVSREKDNLQRSKLFARIHADGLHPSVYSLDTLPLDRNAFPKNLRGILFINSTMTVAWAKYLQSEHIPFVSCNSLFASPPIDMVDFSVDDNIERMVKYLLQYGKRRIGLFYSGRTEGFNELFWRGIRKVKKKYHLPREPYDDIRINWKDSYQQKLERTLKRMKQLNSFPEALISFCDIRDFLDEALQNTGTVLPANFLFLVQRPRSKKVLNPKPGIVTFHAKEKNPLQHLAGYERLRELMFAPAPLRPENRTVSHILCIE